MKKNLIFFVLLFIYCARPSYSVCRNINHSKSVPVIYTSDLFHPHADPDDHWDLATIYAFANQGVIDLLGICLNWSCDPIFKKFFNTPIGDPAVMSVAQLDFITGRTTLCGIGSSNELKSADDAQSDSRINGVNLIIDALKRADHKVIIHIVGSARDVAIAGNREPGLFAKKCAAIYLVAGRSDGQPDEYNVTIDKKAFIRIFQLPCPVYWMPCLKAIEGNRVVLGEYDCWYKFKQQEILPDLSDKMQNYFMFAFKPGWQPDPKSDVLKSFSYANFQWLCAITAEPNRQDIAKYSGYERNMWSTAAFVHSIGKTVTREGEIIDREKDVRDKAVFVFKPVKIKINTSGVLEWSLTEGATNHYIFQKDTKYYDSAMTEALKQLLILLP